MPRYKTNPRAAWTFQTSVTDLDFILGDGIEISEHGAPSIILKGVPGAGKTLLASTIAASMLQQKRSVHYWTLEQRSSEIEASLSQFRKISPGHHAFHHYSIEIGNSIDVDLTTPAFNILQFPLTLYSERTEDNSPVAATSAHLGTMTQLVADLAQQDTDCGMIVVDSLYCSSRLKEPGTLEYQITRGLFQGLCNIAHNNSCIVVLVLETAESLDWRDYVADIVIKLGWHPNRSGVERRSVRIEKARYHSVLDGNHEFAIDRETGVRVIPDSRSVVRRLVRERRPSASCQGLKEKFSSAESLNSFVGDDIFRGTSTLLYGPDSTRKNVILARFLQEGLKSEEDEVLFIAAGTTVDAARDILLRYYNPSEFSSRNKGLDELLERTCIYSILSSGTSDDELFAKIRHLVERKELNRIALDDVAALSNRSDLVLALKDYFVHQGISSMFVHTVNGEQPDLLRESFDNLIEARQVFFEGDILPSVWYHRKKVNGSSRGNSRPKELKFDDEKKDLQFLDRRGAFQSTATGEIRQIPLPIWLMCEYSDVEDDFRRRISQLLGIQGFNSNPRVDLDIFPRQDAELVVEGLKYRSASGQDLAGIVSFDEFELDLLANTGCLENIDSYADDSLLSSLNPLAVRRGKHSKTKRSFGIPSHINCGVYAIRRDILTDDILDRHGICLGESIEWETLLRAAHAGRIAYCGQLAHSDHSNLPLLGVWNGFDESFTSFMLEIIWEALFDDGKFVGFDSELVSSALVRLHSLLNEFDCIPLNATSPPESAVIQRHWVVSYWNLKRLRQGYPEQYAVIPAPSLRVADDTLKGMPVSGEWYLGVAPGIADQDQIRRVLTTLTSEAFSRAVVECQLGLPVTKAFSARFSEQSLFQAYDKSVSRRSIPRYGKCRYELAGAFETIFARSNSPENLENGLMKLKHAIVEK